MIFLQRLVQGIDRSHNLGKVEPRIIIGDHFLVRNLASG